MRDGLILLMGFVAGGLTFALVRKLIRSRDGRKGTEAGRAASAQLMSLSELTGQLAHEIRNPLSTLKVNLKLLQEDWQEPDTEFDDVRRRSLNKLEVVHAEADRLDRILEDFLRFVGRGDAQFETCDANRLVEEIVQFFGPQAQTVGIRIRPSLALHPLLIRAAPALLKQALLNLLLNAQQAMPDGGEIIVRTRKADGELAQIEIADTGPGIPPEARNRIFEAFYSTKPGGTGLGLSTTRRIVQDHGGRIEVHSEAGHGTSFTINIPLDHKRNP